ncbi:hypothetical protein CNYM01_02732 [Colletotrichum nymphaeae SA-01]|uniref:Apple domain-containing protein n=1 Tax=Colletotrichum nymphaeae SA-01 TaxID=1460502 RepID=A0A135T629_9PEZI|nr:hypothetical protein CNYM01_02732 [Colletotrichum nymphaeae SA-01]
MQFTIATIIAFAAAAQAGPLAIRDVCNSAPSGPTTANVEPRSQPAAATADACQKLCEADSGCQSFVFGLPPSGTTPLCYLYADACLALCKQTTGCQAIEFGKPSANEPVQCRLFNVPASSLPAPTNGQTFVAFDIGC